VSGVRRRDVGTKKSASSTVAEQSIVMKVKANKRSSARAQVERKSNQRERESEESGRSTSVCGERELPGCTANESTPGAMVLSRA
jgi:hypothetical protein